MGTLEKQNQKQPQPKINQRLFHLSCWRSSPLPLWEYFSRMNNFTSQFLRSNTEISLSGEVYAQLSKPDLAESSVDVWNGHREKKKRSLVGAHCKYIAQMLIIQRHYKRDMNLMQFFFFFYKKLRMIKAMLAQTHFPPFQYHIPMLFLYRYIISKNVFLHFNLIIDYLHISLDFLNLFSK